MPKKKIYLGFYSRLLINIVILLSSFIMLYWIFTISFKITPEETLNYKVTSNLDYKIYLKDNDFYENEYLEKDMIYVASLIDKIKVNFKYNFDADKYLDLNFLYNIKAKLLIQDASMTHNYYQKEYTLMDNKKLNIKQVKNQTIEENIDLDYNFYNEIASTFRSQYGIDATSKLVVYLTVTNNSDNKNISLNGKDTITMEIPLSEKSININIKYNDLNNSKHIINNLSINVNNYYYIIIITILIIIIIISTIRLTKLLTKLKTKKNKYDKYIKKLLTEYDRLISETATYPKTDNLEIIKIIKFQELVDIRDNLKLPIMYYQIQKHQKSWFYITHENKMYLHIVKAIDLEEK